MSPEYVATRLLEHGGLTWNEFIAITGWPEDKARPTLVRLQREGVVTFVQDINQYAGRFILTHLRSARDNAISARPLRDGAPVLQRLRLAR